MKKNNDIEQILLNDCAFEQAVKTKIEHDFNKFYIIISCNKGI